MRKYRMNLKIGKQVKTVIVKSINMVQLVAACEKNGTEYNVTKVSL